MKIERLEANTSTLRLLAAVFVLGSMVGISQAFYDRIDGLQHHQREPQWRVELRLQHDTPGGYLRCPMRSPWTPITGLVGWNGRPLRTKKSPRDEEQRPAGPWLPRRARLGAVSE